MESNNHPSYLLLFHASFILSTKLSLLSYKFVGDEAFGYHRALYLFLSSLMSTPFVNLHPDTCTIDFSSNYIYTPTEEDAIYKKTRQPCTLRSLSFYLDDPLICIKVSDILYRVHRDKIHGESLRLRSYINQTSGWTKPPGRSDAHPLTLDQCTCAQFEAFLSFIYEKDNDIQRRSVLFYLDLLTFASVYGCPRIADISIICIENRSLQLDPIERLLLGKAHSLLSLQRSAYTSLCIRPTFLSDNEAAQLDKQDILLIGRAQLRILREENTPPSLRTHDEAFWDLVSLVVEQTFFTSCVGGEPEMVGSWMFPEDKRYDETDSGSPEFSPLKVVLDSLA